MFRERECERRRLALLCQTIGHIPVADLTLDDAERAMEKVPKKKRNAQGANKGSEPVLLTAAAGSRA